jgi:hypothetical protein
MEAGGRDKTMPTQLERKVLNPLQERVMKIPRFIKLTQQPNKLAT